MKKAFIACGGTGGHLAPGIALAEELNSRGWECSLLISRKQVDSRLLKKYSDFIYESLPGSPFSIRPIRLIRFAVNLVKGTLRCYARMKIEKPDVVIGFGGFLSMPAIVAACIQGLPTAIHEANRIAGRVTRIVGVFANRIYLPPGVSVRTTRSSRIRPLGMPVRNEIRLHSKSTAKKHFGFDPDKKLLVVMGGSQGAEALNTWLKENLESLAQREIQALCLTGSAMKVDSTMTFRSAKGNEVRFFFSRFSDEMSYVLSAADLVVTRSGAGSIAEIIRCRAPAILVPFPFAADDHQRANARYFEMLGCGLVLDQEYIGELDAEVKDVIYNEWLLQRFRSNMHKADRTDVRAFMANDLNTLVSERAEAPAAGSMKGAENG